jgi:hypothetical protein
MFSFIQSEEKKRRKINREKEFKISRDSFQCQCYSSSSGFSFLD